MKNKKINFTRIKNDINGNPRYVFHFLEIADTYEESLKIAKKFGGKKYHNNQFGGGIVIQSYNIDESEETILNFKQN